ncbi:beta-lactamase/transpeptidase-like protein [Ganoderma leucocontextum]|nr:beta-lactamase/transpeptidase-like protein [Ganoderma leucocontextum]
MPRASVHVRILGTLLALVMVVSARQEVVRLDAPGFRQSNGILSLEWHAYIEQIRQNDSIPGISVGVVRVGEDKAPVMQLASWGRKTEEGDGHDMTPDTLFGIASCSKAFLSTSIGLLMDDYVYGRNVTPLPEGLKHLDWDTKVKDILPKELNWILNPIDGDDSAMRNAKIRDVLGHVSGLPASDFTYRPGDTAESVVRRMGKLRTAYELREKYSYNNQFYILGAYLIAHYANTTYSEFVSERIFSPLGMSSSTYIPSVAAASGKLSHTWHRNGRRIPFWFDDQLASFNGGAGGVISNPKDMVRWLAVWLNDGVDPVSGKTIFPKGVYDAVTTAQTVINGRPSAIYDSLIGYGMGWERWAAGGIDVVHHTGGIPGFTSIVAFSPSHNIGLVALVNTDEARAIFKILKKTFDDVLGTQLSQTADSLGESFRASAQAFMPSTKITPPSLDWNAYTGAYNSDDGYLPVTLCSSQSKSAHCQNVVSDFATIDNSTALATSLYSAYPAVWASHLRLQHFSGDVFNFTFTALFPHGYGQNASAFEAYETGSSSGWLEFKVDKAKGTVEGFSLVGDQNACAARARKTGGALPETADAWFAKV